MLDRMEPRKGQLDHADEGGRECRAMMEMMSLRGVAEGRVQEAAHCRGATRQRRAGASASAGQGHKPVHGRGEGGRVEVRA